MFKVKEKKKKVHQRFPRRLAKIPPLRSFRQSEGDFRPVAPGYSWIKT